MVWKFRDLLSRKTESRREPRTVQPAPVHTTSLPSGADAWFERGNGHISQQQWQLALDCYKEAVSVDSTHARAHAYMGNVLRTVRDPDAALIAYDRAIAAQPDYAEAHYNRGALLLEARQAHAALASFDAALSINPSFAEAHCSRGDAQKELGQLDQALASYNKAIAINERYWRAYLHRGIVQQQLLEPASAEASYHQALALQPDCADARVNLGMLQRAAGRTTAALASCDAAIAAQPGHAGAHAERGLALMALGQLDAAVTSFETAIRLKPDFARAFSNRAEAQAKLGLLAEARASHRQAVLLDPQDAAIRFNHGVFLFEVKEWREAAENFRDAITIQPDHADAYCNLGLVQQETGQADDALESYSHALAINPRLASAFNNRGNLLRARKRFAEASLDYRQAIALDPQSADAHYNNGQLALLQGNLAAGWPEYEWRRRIPEALAVNQRTLPYPAWSGMESLQGKRIFLHAEQGLGDTIQFCRYVSLVADLGAHVMLEVPPSLGELLANLEGISHLLLSGDPLPSADYECSLMSLPGAFRTTLDTIPRQVPYLRADPRKTARWREVLGPRTRPRVGLAWSGNPHNSNDPYRRIPLARWVEHLPGEFDYVGLQNEFRDADRETLSSFPKIRLFEANLADRAALIETLDLVVSVDTSLAHLSGALGKRTWILLHSLPDWRWLLDRRDSPWYPTATLYRQPVAGDWDSVVAEVKRDLLEAFP
jgi:tetratricopeptide (TPR) repeat protein